MTTKWHFFIMIFILSGSVSNAAEIVFETDVKIKKMKESSFSDIKAGTSTSLPEGDSLIVLTPKGLPLVVLAPSSARSKVVITDSNMTSVFDEKLQPSLEQATTEAIDGLRKAEVLIKKKDYAQARSLVNDLKGKYSRISSILFMSGTIHYLMNNRPSAIEDLEKGLQIDSQNEAAKKLLVQMRGTP
ncbi:MAG: hypothetical protein KF789_10575 [Bdellovibrionaceae bacterium]|nr:hypothetical protein [Pseudobdellovibrionaceae bacterium]